MDNITDNVASIVLAAGYSSRMGSSFKPLLRLGRYTAVERTVKTHLDAGIGDVIVVVGYRADDVTEAVKQLGVGVVTNRHFDRGMFSSVQTGVATLKPDIRAFFIMPADIPLVKPATILAILDNYATGPCGIIYPAYRGIKGHPPLITSRFASEIMESPAPDGLRGILKKHEDEARYLEVADEAILMDMDTLKDYSQLIRYESQGGISL